MGFPSLRESMSTTASTSDQKFCDLRPIEQDPCYGASVWRAPWENVWPIRNPCVFRVSFRLLEAGREAARVLSRSFTTVVRVQRFFLPETDLWSPRFKQWRHNSFLYNVLQNPRGSATSGRHTAPLLLYYNSPVNAQSALPPRP